MTTLNEQKIFTPTTTGESQKLSRGRPKKYQTEEELLEANREKQKRYRERNEVKTVALRPDCIGLQIEEHIRSLIRKEGLRKILSQILQVNIDDPTLDSLDGLNLPPSPVKIKIIRKTKEV